jgi:dTDP-4-dehydrorhamnose reductase
VRAITTAEYPAKAPRPAYSVLDTGRLREVFDLQPPHWRVGLSQTLLELVEARRALAAAGIEG